MILVSTVNSCAEEASYFSKFKDSEIIVVLDAEPNWRKVTLYLTKIDNNNNIIEGLTNEGKVYIPVHHIMYMYEQDKTIQAIHNHCE